MICCEIHQVASPDGFIMAKHSVIFIDEVVFGCVSKVISEMLQMNVLIVWNLFPSDWKILDKLRGTFTDGSSRTFLLKFFIFSGATSQKGLKPTPKSLEIGSAFLSVNICLSDNHANLDPKWGLPTVIKVLAYWPNPKCDKANLASTPLNEKLTKSQL